MPGSWGSTLSAGPRGLCAVPCALIVPRDVAGGRIALASVAAAGCFGPLPAGAGLIRPPRIRIFERHGAARRPDAGRTRDELLDRDARIILGIGDPFGDRHVPGGRDELRKLLVRDRRFVHPEGIDRDEM